MDTTKTTRQNNLVEAIMNITKVTRQNNLVRLAMVHKHDSGGVPPRRGRWVPALTTGMSFGFPRLRSYLVRKRIFSNNEFKSRRNVSKLIIPVFTTIDGVIKNPRQTEGWQG